MLLKSIYNLLGAVCVGNGFWMLASASSWFQNMPLAIEDTGPFNAHFVHDLGLVFLLSGIGLFWCAYKINDSFIVHLGVTLFITGHALIHVVEILLGLLPPEHWWIDFPLITLPAIILILLGPISFKKRTQKG